MADSADNTAELDAEIAAARERYAEERAKRIKPDGEKQYSHLSGKFADFDTDPYVEPGFTREPIVEEFTAVILGGGFAGMMTAVELTKHGIRDFRVIEKGGDFGGTWYWNRYPGCMCDVESYTYLPLLEETGFMPTEKYASAPEIFRYCQTIGEHFDLYPHAIFQTEVRDAVWNDETGRWTIHTTRDDVITAQFFITAGGILHKAKLPGIPGIEDFEGHAFHTSRWDYDYTGGSPTEPMDKLADKRIGIVGTGATGVQAVPKLAEAAKELYVFQRTPAAVGFRGNQPTDVEWFESLEPGWHDKRVENFTHCVTGVKPDEIMVDDEWVGANWDNTQFAADTPEEQAELDRLDYAVMDGIRQRVADLVDDPETAEKLKPWYGKHCKRLTFHDDFLPAFNRPNVHLVDTDGRGLEQITATGAVVDGVEYPLDAIVFASGFEIMADFKTRLGFDPAGRDGVRLSERWHDGAHTLHGVLSHDFPNMMMISIIQAGFGVNFVHFLGKSAEHCAWLVNECVSRGIDRIEPSVEAEEDWFMQLLGQAGRMGDYSINCTPSYYNNESNFESMKIRNLVYTGSLLDYAGFLEEWRDTGELPGTITS